MNTLLAIYLLGITLLWISVPIKGLGSLTFQSSESFPVTWDEFIKLQPSRFVIDAQSRHDEKQTGSGVIEVSEGHFDLRFDDALSKITHHFSSQRQLHAIQYHDQDTLDVLKLFAKSGDDALCQEFDTSSLQQDTIPFNLLNDVTFDAHINNCGHHRFATTLLGRHVVLCTNENFIVQEAVLSNVRFRLRPDNKKTGPVLSEKVLSQCGSTLQRSVKKVLKAAGSSSFVSAKAPVTSWFSSEKHCKSSKFADKDACASVHRARAAPTLEKPTCVFLHGVGVWDSKPLSDSFDYWGNVQSYTSLCNQTWFIHTETKMRGWDNEALQDEFCDAILVGNKPGDRVARNKLLYVHSMGNLVLAGALQAKKCSIDPKTVHVFDAEGPLNGSPAADFLQTVCAQQRNKLYETIARLGGYCQPNTTTTYPAYKTLSPHYPGVAGKLAFAKKYVRGNMCGSSPLGLYSPYSVLYLLSKIVNYGEANDGMVPFRSCALRSSGIFEEDYESQWYIAKVNHADGTCRSGDGWWDRARAPCSWYGMRS